MNDRRRPAGPPTKENYAGYLVPLLIALLILFVAFSAPGASAGVQTFRAQILEGNTDGTPRAVSTLRELNLWCNPVGSTDAELFHVEPLALTAPGVVAFDVDHGPGTFECAARVVTNTGVDSPRSNVIIRTWEESRPLAPALDSGDGSG